MCLSGSLTIVNTLIEEAHKMLIPTRLEFPQIHIRTSFSSHQADLMRIAINVFLTTGIILKTIFYPIWLWVILSKCKTIINIL